MNNLKSSANKWKNKIPAKDNLLHSVTNNAIAIKATKSTISDKFASKQPHEVLKAYVKAELKEIILTEIYSFAVQKNSTFVLSMADLNLFHAILVMTGYHSLPHTRLYWENDGVGIPLIYNIMSRGHQAIYSFCRQ